MSETNNRPRFRALVPKEKSNGETKLLEIGAVYEIKGGYPNDLPFGLRIEKKGDDKIEIFRS